MYKLIFYLLLSLLGMILITIWGYFIGTDQYPILRQILAAIGGAIIGFLGAKAGLHEGY